MVIGRIRKDYQAWLDLGPGGVTPNFRGYMLGHILEFKADRDIKSTKCYDSITSNSYLKNIPVREGSAPEISKWLFPVRQVSARAGKDRIQLVVDMLEETASKNKHIFVARSLLEGGHSVALFIADENKKKIPGRTRELFHCHDSEGSMHTTLSPADAAHVLDQGWGERHPLSGKIGIALSYVMVYAPRSDAEMVVLKQVAQAAIDYGYERRERGEL